MFHPFRLLQLLFVSTALLATVSLQAQGRGTLIESQELGTLTREQLNGHFQSLGLTARNGVRLVRVTYETVVTPSAMEPVAASGLVLVPEGAAGSMPWISLQHWTVAGKKEAPSLNPAEGLYEASQGFVTTAMDYLGYGASDQLFHPYLVAEAYVPAGIDILRATQSLLSPQGISLDSLFLKGYSEGGYATVALQRALETDHAGEFPLKASSPAAGPYDLEAAALKALAREASNALVSTFLLLSYDTWVAPEIDLDAIFAIDAQAVVDLYNSGLSSSEIQKHLPGETRKLIDVDFLDDFLLDEPTRPGPQLIRSLLRGQSLIESSWVPQVPTRLYHCTDDEVVAVESTRNTLAHWKQLDATAPVTALILDSPATGRPYDHSTCPLVFAAVGWFQEIVQKEKLKERGDH